VESQFFEQPILSSPYEYPARHWQLDEDRQPTGQIVERRRTAEFITPIPKPRKRKGPALQQRMIFDEDIGLSSDEQEYASTAEIIRKLRLQVDQWRMIPNPAQWRVTPETQRLLQHWRSHEFKGARPFFCQIEAVETAIWLTEVAPDLGATGQEFLDHLKNANNDANPGLLRLALKLATGAGKTTVMAMLIAWQTVNAVRHPQSRRFTRGFLVVAPGITIKDRLRVLQPNDPDSYYASRELVPVEMLDDLKRAKIVITNYHAFKLRERVELSKGGRSLLQGRGKALDTLETEGQMIQRVMPDLMGMKNVLVLNDEAHHCYRERPDRDDEGDLSGEEKQEARENNEAARVWISGLEIVSKQLGINRIVEPAGPAEDAADRQRAARVRRGAGPELPRDGRRRDRAVPTRDSRAGRSGCRRDSAGRRAGRRHAAARGDEHGREAGATRRADPLRDLGLDADGGLGRQYRHPRAGRAGVRDAAPLRAGNRPGAATAVV